MKKKKKKIKLEVKGLDKISGTLYVKEKRSLHNRAKFVEFFSSEGKYYRNRKHVLETFTPHEINTVARLYLEFGFELEEIFAYARRFKKAVERMSETDLDEVNKVLEIQKVMDS